MANKTSTLTVRLIDAVAAPARSAANAIRGIGAAVDQTNARRLNIAGAVQTTVRDVGRATERLKKNLHGLTSGLAMPAGLATFFGARSVYNFEKMSNKLEAVTNMTGEQKKQIQGYAKELNELFPFTNEQIMSAAFELGRAGFKYEQIIGSLKDTLNLSLAGDIELQEASDIATNILTAMRLPTKTADQTADSLRRVNDALAFVAANSNTDVRMMGETFKYVGPMAAAAGLSIEEVAAASMVMATNGIRASEAGVAMRSALVRMVRPTKPMLAALEQMNVNIDDFIKRGRIISANDIVKGLELDGIDASGYAKQIEAVLNDPSINKSLSKLTAKLADIVGGDGSAMDKSKLAEVITDTLTAAGSEIDFFGFLQALREKGADVGDVARIFDARQGSRLITLLAGDLLGSLERVQKEGAGATDKMAKTMMQGVVGDWAAFVASIENLFLSIAESGVLKVATDAIKSLTDGLKWLSEANPTLLKFGSLALMLTVALAPVALVLGGVISSLMLFANTIRTVGTIVVGAYRIIKAALGAGAAGTAAAATAAGAASAGGAAAAGAAGATVAGAASKTAGKAGFFSKFMKGAGIVGAAVTTAEVLNWIDPEGNLWGLTSGIDKWAEEKFGFNPSKIGGSKEPPAPVATPEQAAAYDLSERNSRLAEVNDRLGEIEKSTHPAMRDAPNIERENLELEKVVLEQKIEAIVASQPAPEIKVNGVENNVTVEDKRATPDINIGDADKSVIVEDKRQSPEVKVDGADKTITVEDKRPIPALPEKSTSPEMEMWINRQAEIDARLKQIERNLDRTSPETANFERESLKIEREAIQQVIDANPSDAVAAAKETMGSYNAELSNGLAEAEALIRERVARMIAELNFTVTPTIAPRVDMSGISGVHADVGVG